VALAVPLFAQLPALRRHRWKLLLALACGGLASALSNRVRCQAVEG
jgi:putative effector of murein hydrolase